MKDEVPDVGVGAAGDGVADDGGAQVYVTQGGDGQPAVFDVVMDWRDDFAVQLEQKLMFQGVASLAFVGEEVLDDEEVARGDDAGVGFFAQFAGDALLQGLVDFDATADEVEEGILDPVVAFDENVIAGGIEDDGAGADTDPAAVGEPFLFYATLMYGVRSAAAMGFQVGIVSNAYGATSKRDARELLRPLAGLEDDLSLSEDAYHRTEENLARAPCPGLRRA